jgi:hypothetical protein
VSRRDQLKRLLARSLQEKYITDEQLDRPDYNFNIDLDELKQPTEYLDNLEEDDDESEDE